MAILVNSSRDLTTKRNPLTGLLGQHIRTHYAALLDVHVKPNSTFLDAI